MSPWERKGQPRGDHGEVDARVGGLSRKFINAPKHLRRSSLKGRGRSRVVAGPFLVPDPVCGRADEAAGSRLGRSPTAERPEGLDGVAVRRILFGLSGRVGGVLAGVGSVGLVDVARIMAGVSGSEQAVGCSVIPSRRPGGQVPSRAA